ncbi:MAG TPA: serine/threonine-protein kinase [Gemmatimonadales bacterium]|jgi:serine/threonine-protein kinase
MSPSGPFDIQPITSPASGARGAEGLPDDLAEEAAGRLRIVALVMAGLWGIGITVNHLIFPYLDLRPEQIVPWTPVSDLVGLVSIVLSSGVYAVAPRVARDPERLATLAIAYEVALALGAGIVNQWYPVALAGRLSWICVVILLFPLLVPGSTRMVLIGSFLAASMDPVGILVARARGVEVPSLALVAWTYLPNYICAVLAVIPSKILAHLSRKVARARQLGSYRLVEQIGRGGMGEVWRAEHRLFARPAAIKLITARRLEEASSVAEERFRREAQAAAALRSPHTIQLYDFGITRDRRPYYVMELLDGCDLETLISRYGAQPAARVAYVLRQACHSLAEAHVAGLVHRDIKPANLHIGRLGLDYDFVKVLDFGLVKRQDGPSERDLQLTAPEAISGTPAYMAPEMASGQPVDSRADLYALGCVGYYLVTGQRIFEGTHPMQVLVQHLQSEPVPPSVRIGRPVPPALEGLLLQCVAKSPDDRPQDATWLAEALGAAGADEWTQADARRWWETTFTSAPAGGERTRSSPALLEVAPAGGEASE